jgi:hypothetical protein
MPFLTYGRFREVIRDVIHPLIQNLIHKYQSILQLEVSISIISTLSLHLFVITILLGVIRFDNASLSFHP